VDGFDLYESTTPSLYLFYYDDGFWDDGDWVSYIQCCGLVHGFIADPDPDPVPGTQTNADPDPGQTFKAKKLNFHM
jgi:hypothetical protein